MKMLPIAETFTSPQGEGVWTGLLMFFIRLAGCSVGVYEQGSSRPATCTAYGGKFECDTDYKRTFSMLPGDLADQCKVTTICLSGGEPCDHGESVGELINIAHQKGLRVHLETSGTKWQSWLHYVDHITVSPKRKYLPEVLHLAHELRFLWDPAWLVDRSEESLIDEIEQIIRIANKDKTYPSEYAKVYISPVNHYSTVNQENVQEVLKLLEQHSSWSLSCQLHKYLGVR